MLFEGRRIRKQINKRISKSKLKHYWVIIVGAFFAENHRRDGLVGYDAAFTRLRSGVQFPFSVCSDVGYVFLP